MTEQRRHGGETVVVMGGEALRFVRAAKLPLTWEGILSREHLPWSDVVAAEEEYEPLTAQTVEAAVLRAGLANLLSRMGSLIEALDSAAEQMKALDKRVAALEERLAEQGIVRSVMLCDLGHEAYTLRCPITIIVEEYEEETVARLPEVRAFGSAPTEAEALASLKDDIVRLYEDLVSTPEDQLGTLPRQWRAVLLRLIEKNGPA